MDKDAIAALGMKAREALISERKDLYDVLSSKADRLARVEADKLHAQLMSAFEQQM
ncbi:MAG: hypothetical protein K9H25_04505 [Rhodospirillum sp.]|nr:hypothetical protein [Rhodospirillum sp.]MCF8488357.1 hypothetical protein [Rhodospirillum sp.]